MFTKLTPYIPTGALGQRWYLIDANGLVLGRLASVVASRIRGKHRAEFTPNADNGDFIIIVNADKIKLTGKKLTDKIYYRHSGYPGGLRETAAGKLLNEKPTNLISIAVRKMLPKNRLGYHLKTKLKVYAGDKHPHSAQKPETITIN